MARPRKKNYETGDQIHFLISDDFVSTANRFFEHCDANMINASAAMRRAMTEWLDKYSGSSPIVEIPLASGPQQTTAIEDAFIIYRDGALLAHATSRVIPNLDMELFSSMLTLIQAFITESFTDFRDTGLRMIEFGERTIIIEPSKTSEIILAIVYSGEMDRYAIDDIANAILYEIEFTFGYELREFDGNLEKVRGMREIIMSHLYNQ